MPSAPGGPRLLLRRLREIMAEPVGAQDRLDKIVTQIAANMVAEVCSVYVMRGDGVLELFATEGLNREAVHLTVMRSGEGLVGLIASTAEPLALSDAQSHPAFSYKPETGEEIYHAFLGVPLLRAGNTLGVLVVQNRTYRAYAEEEMEALQTTAMVLAEMLASGELQALAPGAETVLRRSLQGRGAPLSEGVGLGHVVLHEPRVVVRNLIAEDVPRELARLDEAIADVRASIDELIERGDVAHGGEHREVLETFRMFAHDQGWLRRMREAVLSGLTAEAAVERVQSDNRARLMRQTAPYLRDRLHDLDDLANRLLHKLVGRDFVVDRAALPDNAILVARSMGPAALLDYDRSRLRGLVLEEGGPNSHIAIVARALGIPAVSEIENATALVEAGDPIIVDGGLGDVQIRPPIDVELAYAEKARLRARRQEQYRRLRDEPAVTRDGVAVSLQLNAGLLVDLPHLIETGAEGVGLFRTELQFMIAEHLPSPSEQQALYRAVFTAADDRPGLLRAQMRGLLKAAAGRHLNVMFPMVATVDEFLRAKAIVEREQAHLTRHGHEMPTRLSLGVMIEIPSLLFQIDEIAAEADFLSVGSNDLMQYLFAADRENRLVANRFDPLSVPNLRALRLVAERAAATGCHAGVCGEIGGKPLEAMALIGLGYRHLSMSAASIRPVKAMILTLEADRIAAFLDEELASSGSSESLRPALVRFAEKHGIA